MVSALANGKTLVSDADHVQLERLVTEAAWRVDGGRADTLYELFVEDGMLLLGNSELKGHDAIRNWGRQLEDAQIYKCIRHVAGNMRFNLLSESDDLPPLIRNLRTATGNRVAPRAASGASR